MILAAHQLHYLPWLRYIHKMAQCDTFVVMDDIQFNKNGWQNRNKIKGHSGAQLLSIPIRHKRGQRLDEVKIDSSSAWRRKHWKSLEACYGRAPFFSSHAGPWETLYTKEWEKLNDINTEGLAILMTQLGLQPKIVASSSLGITTQATQRLVDICKALGARAYLTGEYAAQTYLDVGLLKKAGLELLFQRYEAPVYTQQFERQGFIPELSIVDLLFNHGNKSLGILNSSYSTLQTHAV